MGSMRRPVLAKSFLLVNGSALASLPRLRVFWSSNAQQRFFWRTDVRGAAPALSTNVTHRGGLLRLQPLEGVGHFVGLHLDGGLTLYHGDSGAVVATLQLEPAGYANQTAPSLQFDPAHSLLFVAVPARGAIHAVQLTLPDDAAEHSDHDGHDHSSDGVSRNYLRRSLSRRSLLQQQATEAPAAADSGAAPVLQLVRSVAVGGSPGGMTVAYMPGVGVTAAAK
ncbi:hypothetical protein GPECTOR_49g516 [Gonium pectorale]|uniref:Uncharacterized protein n=1 Tax=Gonium pectorale TaxID=33097 RepID=A0A150G7W1_GONPE|nr:hypothetical protein GPECTOR_49g516 [Gonium pectorale]|eukprot:KXZ45932.1 hypothetical protein GPECTOR_49g516 [Gonium pectorale]